MHVFAQIPPALSACFTTQTLTLICQDATRASKRSGRNGPFILKIALPNLVSRSPQRVGDVFPPRCCF